MFLCMCVCVLDLVALKKKKKRVASLPVIYNQLLKKAPMFVDLTSQHATSVVGRADIYILYKLY